MYVTKTVNLQKKKDVLPLGALILGLGSIHRRGCAAVADGTCVARGF